MKNLFLTVVASIGLVVSIVLSITPIPGGAPLMALSLTSLTCTSPRARSCIRYFRERASIIDKIFFMLEDKIGSHIAFIGDALKLTRPGTKE